VNYLQLCQDFVSEHGIGGGTGPNAVTAQVGELRNVCRWIADAALDTDNLWLDWKYLWRRYTATLAAGQSIAPEPADSVRVRLWDIHKMQIRQAGGSWSGLTYYPRNAFESLYGLSNTYPGMPAAFTILPNNSVQFQCVADQDYELAGEFWRSPVRLAANTDCPLIPREYHRVIMARAAIYYGNREDAPEIISGAEAEYLSIKDKLEADQLEDQSRRRSSTDRERFSQWPHAAFLR
jgi:hypothetical protein